MKNTRTAAELQLYACHGCGRNCNECADIDAVLDSIMSLRYEIDAQEDALEREIERLAG